jgi:hypothetical protein
LVLETQKQFNYTHICVGASAFGKVRRLRMWNLTSLLKRARVHRAENEQQAFVSMANPDLSVNGVFLLKFMLKFHFQIFRFCHMISLCSFKIFVIIY